MKDKPFKVKRIGGYLHKVTTLKDAKGNIVEHIITPLMVELRPRDILQVIIGASILAIPVGMTEETWNLGAELPLFNVLLLTLIGIFFIAFFVYFNFYRDMLKEHKLDYIKRIFMIYTVSLIVVTIFLALIQKLPLFIETEIAIKRLLLITFPCSMSATISDGLK
ncbi:MAG: DUF2391 family protein [Halanaerobiaceae bacterium]